MKNIFNCLRPTKSIEFISSEFDTVKTPIEINNPIHDLLLVNNKTDKDIESKHELLFVLLYQVTRNVHYTHSLGLTSDAIFLSERFKIYKFCIQKLQFLENCFEDCSSKYDFLMHIATLDEYLSFYDSLYSSNHISYAEICKIKNKNSVKDEDIFYRLTRLFCQFLNHPQYAQELLTELEQLNFDSFDYIPSLDGYNQYNYVHYDYPEQIGEYAIPKISEVLKCLKSDVLSIYHIYKAKNKFNHCLRNYKDIIELPIYLKGMIFMYYKLDVYFFAINVSTFIKKFTKISEIKNEYKRFYVMKHYIRLLVEYKLITMHDSKLGYMLLIKTLKKCENERFRKEKYRQIKKMVKGFKEHTGNYNIRFFEGLSKM